MSVFKRKPKIHQKKGARFAVEAGYSLLAMDMGLGKSMAALMAWKHSGAERLLVVCPASLVYNWKKEINETFGEDTYNVAIFDQGKVIHEPWNSDIVIISYDLGQKDKDEVLFEWCDFLILDEPQELKSMSAQRTEYYHKAVYRNQIPGLVLLSGTPIQNRVEEYYSLICLCYYNPEMKSKFLKKYPTSTDFAEHFSYKKEYEILRGNKRVKIIKYSGHRNVKELKKWLKPIYFRVKFDDVMDLEPVAYKDILMKESKDAELAKEYKRLAKMYIEDEDASRSNSKRKRESAIEKVPFTNAYVKGLLDQGECVVVYSDHVESATAIADRFGVPVITGETPSKKRFKICQEFQAGKREVIVATIGALSTGIDLIRSANLVFNDLPWVPGKEDQVIGRIRRIGQTRICTVHRIFGSPQDQAIAEALKDKRKTIKAVT